MHVTNRKLFLVLTALIEAPLGFCLLVLPDLPLAILLGIQGASAEGLFVARVAGAALVCIGVASWMARSDTFTPSQFGLLTGILAYDTTAAILLLHAGTTLKLVGIGLWPAFGLHAVLALWCLSCLRPSGS